MAVKCGECGNRERFSAAADLSVELTVNCDGDVVAHDLDRVLAALSLRPNKCADCGSKQLVESEYISDKEWDSQIFQALERRRMQEQIENGKTVRLKGRRRAS